MSEPARRGLKHALIQHTLSDEEVAEVTRVVPMIHVPDVRTTAEWYEAIGFTLMRAHEEDGKMDWALLSFGASEVMFNEGGRASTEFRREVDLYVCTDDVDGCYERIKDRVETVEVLHDTFYGMREFIIRDINRFWMTFGQPIRRD